MTLLALGLSHEQAARKLRKLKVGGSMCVGGSMKERLSSLIPFQAAQEVLTN